ncbi:post-GPI attachment to proteins factor 2-like [Paramacrobiotus metropolitanus]|uniref:post-GPI attachment to proteins factor 2-like n=1 Tax=Paramacrobiotus metropolitanus TaxID=2943436 RepID=UPI002445C096|nr:post-GPI attachment to proteins factor 2-like [Paramacrobiotus metropolitanus]
MAVMNGRSQVFVNNGPYATTNGHITVPHVTVQNVLVRINFARIVIVITLLPFCGLLVCLFSCMLFQFEQVTITFCPVTNYLPSISAVTGVRPQTHLWRLCIALHCTPRFLIALLYRATFKQNLDRLHPSGPFWSWYSKIITVDFAFSVVENISLLMVSVVSSPDNYPVHEKCFITFLITSIGHMIMCCYLYPNLFFQPFLSECERTKSLLWKRRILSLVFMLAAGMAIFFFRHRRYCAPGAFSYFAFCEYWLAILNMGFHATSCWDFVGKELVIAGWPKDELVVNGKSYEYALQLSKSNSDKASE